MTIPATHLLYPTPERVAEARDILHRELITGEYLHPAVRANCEQVLRFNDEINGAGPAAWNLTDAQYNNDLQEAREDGRAQALREGVWTMTQSEFTEALREAHETGFDQGFSACNAEYGNQRKNPSYPIMRVNPYKAKS